MSLPKSKDISSNKSRAFDTVSRKYKYSKGFRLKQSQIGDSRGQKSKDAKAFLTDILSDGQKRSKEIEELALEKGIKKKTLFNAKREMNIDSVKIGNQWFWLL